VTQKDLIAIFGLLHSKLVSIPEDTPVETTTLDHFEIQTFTDTCTFRCKCGRTDQFALLKSDLEKIRPVAGTFACPICVEELKAARSASAKVHAWFNQNRTQLNPEAHVYLPTVVARLVDLSDSTIMRPRRFVYSKFYNVELRQKDKILNTCGDPDCLNPYHMMRAASPAAKVTPAMREDVLLWMQQRLHPRTIKELLHKKYQVTVSLRTITNIRKSVLA